MLGWSVSFFLIGDGDILQADSPHFHQIAQSLQQSIINFLPIYIYIALIVKFQALRAVSLYQEENDSDLFFAA